MSFFIDGPKAPRRKQQPATLWLLSEIWIRVVDDVKEAKPFADSASVDITLERPIKIPKPARVAVR